MKEISLIPKEKKLCRSCVFAHGAKLAFLGMVIVLLGMLRPVLRPGINSPKAYGILTKDL